MDANSLFLCCLFAGLNCVLSNDVEYCPDGTFQPEVGAACRQCSRCPENQIVRETCWRHRDTVCGPFTEFHPFLRGDKTDKLHSDISEISETNTITEHEADDSVTTSWQTVSTMMIILLAVTSVICVVLIVTVCYRCRRDKKDGLMIYVEKEPDEIQAMPGCSGASISGSDQLNTAHARELKSQSNPNNDISGNDNKQNKTKMQQFEIAEGSEAT